MQLKTRQKKQALYSPLWWAKYGGWALADPVPLIHSWEVERDDAGGQFTLSLFYSVQDFSLWNGAAHIEGGPSYFR